MKPLLPCLVLVNLSLLADPAAFAQQVDPQKAVAAQALYDQAVAEMEEKKYPSACKKLEEVTALVPEGIGARLTLGECYEASGRLASAWSQYALATSLAEKAAQSERAQRAAERASALKDRLATLTIEVPKEVSRVAGLTVTRDGVPIGAAQWGTPVPVDTGAHEIVASAPGYKPWRKSIEVVADASRVEVAVKPLTVDGATSALPGAPSAPERTWQRPAAFVTAGLGLVGLGLGATFGGLAIARNDASRQDDHCDAQNRCDPQGLALRSEARGFGNASTAMFIAGGMLAAGGVVLFATAPTTKTERLPVSVSVAALPGGLVARGQF